MVEVNIDADPRNADWIKTQHWEFSTDAQMFLWQIGGVDQLEHFMTLPAADKMPHALAIDLAVATGKKFPLKALKYSPDQPRDDHGRFGSGDGTTTLEAAPTPMTDEEFTKIWNENNRTDVSSVFGVPSKDQEAVSYYTGSGYLQVNGGLRGGYPVPHGFGDGFNSDTLSHMDDWTHSDTLDRPTMLYRAGSNVSAEQIPTEVGTRFVDHGYVSTSATEDYKPSNLDHQQGIEIEAPAGTPFGTGTFGEREVILPRESTFEVVGDDDGLVRVKLVKAG